MKAITLHQPFATLIAIGAKQYETRHWCPRNHWRGEIAIHAGNSDLARHHCHESPFFEVLSVADGAFTDFGNLPKGAILCVCELVAVYDAWKLRPHLSKQELAFGNYQPGRFAWKLEVKYVLPEPVKVKGQQGLWNWQP